MSTITLRQSKGSVLTHNEVDANFSNLNADKVEKVGTDAVSVTVNSSSTALAVAQTGSGAALSVKSSTNAASLGTELLTNGAFTANATGWTLGSGWSYGTNNVVADANAAGTLTQSVTVANGTQYYLTFSATLSAANNALVTVKLGTVEVTAVCRTDVTGANAYAVMLTANTSGAVNLEFSIVPISGSGTITIDDISLKVVTAIPASTTLLNPAGAVVGELRNTLSSNVSFGVNSLSSNTTGYGNSAFGVNSLISNTTGYNNSALGRFSLQNNTTGEGNSGFGTYSLQNNTTGDGNSGFGANSIRSNTTGYNNSAFGRNSLQNNTTGYNNSALGRFSLQNNTTGYGNSGFGLSALNSNTTGYSNSAVGRDAGRYSAGLTPNEISNTSTYLGYLSRASASGATNEIVLGHDVQGSGSNTVTIGNTATTNQKLYGAVQATTGLTVGTAALTTNATSGFAWIPSCAGAPTGAPSAPYTNAAALVVDTTNSRLYVLVGSTWKYASLT